MKVKAGSVYRMKIKAGNIYKMNEPAYEWRVLGGTTFVEYIRIISKRKTNKKKILIKKEVIQVNSKGDIDTYGPNEVKESGFKSLIKHDRYVLTDEADLAKAMLGGNNESR